MLHSDMGEDQDVERHILWRRRVGGLFPGMQNRGGVLAPTDWRLRVLKTGNAGDNNHVAVRQVIFVYGIAQVPAVD